jgi:hypothetical protein
MKATVSVVFLFALACGSVLGSPTVLGTAYIDNHNNQYSSQAQLWGGSLTGGSYYTGVYSWTNEQSMNPTGLGQHVPNWGFCVELTQGTIDGWTNVINVEDAPLPPNATYGIPMGITKANYIRELWGRNFNSSWSTGGNTDGAQAFGAAIWEIVFETGPWDVTSGTVYGSYSSAVGTLANQWLSQLTGNSAYFASNLCVISTDAGQDFLVQVPEPVTLALVGLGGLLLRRRAR